MGSAALSCSDRGIVLAHDRTQHMIVAGRAARSTSSPSRVPAFAIQSPNCAENADSGPPACSRDFRYRFDCHVISAVRARDREVAGSCHRLDPRGGYIQHSDCGFFDILFGLRTARRCGSRIPNNVGTRRVAAHPGDRCRRAAPTAHRATAHRPGARGTTRRTPRRHRRCLAGRLGSHASTTLAARGELQEHQRGTSQRDAHSSLGPSASETSEYSTLSPVHSPE
jgi:hypothetical protein